jgi:hypothetical protein
MQQVTAGRFFLWVVIALLMLTIISAILFMVIERL